MSDTFFFNHWKLQLSWDVTRTLSPKIYLYFTLKERKRASLGPTREEEVVTLKKLWSHGIEGPKKIVCHLKYMGEEVVGGENSKVLYYIFIQPWISKWLC